jgi:hypothetical protein
VDRFLEPFYWYDFGNERWFALALSLVDTRARLLPLDATLARTFDPYAFIRNAFFQRRLYQVYDGNVPEEMLDEMSRIPRLWKTRSDARARTARVRGRAARSAGLREQQVLELGDARDREHLLRN